MVHRWNQFLKSSVLCVSILVSQTACAEDAKSPISRDIDGAEANAGGAAGVESTELELTAIKFVGKGAGRDCDVYVALLEDEHEDDEAEDSHDHGHEPKMLVRVDYSVHGVAVYDSVVDFFNYDIETDEYLDEDTKNEDTRPVMASVALVDGSFGDINGIDGYKTPLDRKMVQSVIVRFEDDMDIHDFKSAVESVVEGESTLADNEVVFGMFDRVELELWHEQVGHFDPGLCSDFRTRKMEVVENVPFNLSIEDGDTDDGDDGDHDHDHDHADHNNAHGQLLNHLRKLK